MKQKKRNCKNCGNVCEAMLWVVNEAAGETLGAILEYSEQCEGWRPKGKVDVTRKWAYRLGLLHGAVLGTFLGICLMLL